MRRLIQTGALLVLLMGTAHAQYTNQSGGNTAGSSPLNMNMMPDNRRHLTPEEAQREREIESQYNQTINEKIPNKKTSNDPWGIVRKQQK